MMSMNGNRKADNGFIPISHKSLRIRRRSSPPSLSLFREDTVRLLNEMIENKFRQKFISATDRQLDSTKAHSFKISRTNAKDESSPITFLPVLPMSNIPLRDCLNTSRTPIDISNGIEQLFISTTHQLDPITPPNSPIEESQFFSETWPLFPVSNVLHAPDMITDRSDSIRTSDSSTVFDDRVDVTASSKLFQYISGSSSTAIATDLVIERDSFVPIDMNLSDSGVNPHCPVEHNKLFKSD